MSPVREPIACAGVPRELGFAQGQALRGVIRARVGHGLRAWLRPRSAAAARLDRDLWHHHPQLAERSGGIALGAGVARRALVEALAAAGADASVLPAAALRAPHGAARLLSLLAPLPGAEEGWILRRSRADAGIPVLELVRAWLAPAHAGVNEAGLAVAASAATRAPGEADACAVPAFALVSDCLQRFATAAAAKEWCLRRPVGGSASILAADAAGRVAGVEIAGGVPRALTLEAGARALLGSGSEPLRDLLAKALAAPGLDDVGLAAALLPLAPGATAFWFDPAGRRAARAPLALGARPEWIAL